MAQRSIKNQDIAIAFIDSDLYKQDLIYCSEWKTFFKYNEGIYEEIPMGKMEKVVHSFIKLSFPDVNVNTGLVRDVLQQIVWTIYRSVDEIRSTYIALQDKLLDLSDFSFQEFDRTRVAIHQMNLHSVDLNKPTPLFEKFLSEILVDSKGETDTELIHLVQEMFGFYLLNELKPHAVFFLVGQGRNGKSVLLKMLAEMIGKKFTTAMSIQYLTTNEWAMGSLVGKKINICNEEESKYLRSDKFKALVSGDTTQANRKFLDPIVFEPQVKYIFATNELPTFEGINVGLKERIYIVPFKRIFKEGERDYELTEKLLGEIGGILAWSIEGAKRLKKNGYRFSKSKAVSKAMDEFIETISSPIAFMNELYQPAIERTTFIGYQQLYEDYQVWCGKRGQKFMNRRHFIKELKQNLNLEPDQARVDGVVSKGFWLDPKDEEEEGETQIEIVSEPVTDIDDLLKNQSF